MLQIELTEADYRRVRDALRMGPRATDSAIRAAVRRTISPGAEQLRRRVRETINVTAAAVREVITTKLAPFPGLYGDVRVSQRPIPLVEYKHTATKRGGVTVRIFKSGAPLVLRWAFKQRMPGGGAIIAQRVKGRATKRAAHRTASGLVRRLSGRLNRAGFTTVLPIKKNYGPSVRDLIAKGGVRPLGRETQKDLSQRFQRNLQSQIRRYLAGKNIGFLTARNFGAGD